MDFTFDFERIIDDFILLAFFVGNDFLPNLPYLHINEGALAYMFDIYKRSLPTCGGYINDAGIINLDRLEIIILELEKMEYEAFEIDCSNDSWVRAKQTGQYQVTDRPAFQVNGPLRITPKQKLLVQNIQDFSLKSEEESLDLSSDLNAADRKFVIDMATSLGLEYQSVTDDQGEKHIQLNFKEDFELEEEGKIAMQRIFRKYHRAEVSEQTLEEAEAAMERKYQEKFEEWKDRYYRVSPDFEDFLS